MRKQIKYSSVFAWCGSKHALRLNVERDWKRAGRFWKNWTYCSSWFAL